jgi:hypothetical protein
MHASQGRLDSTPTAVEMSNAQLNCVCVCVHSEATRWQLRTLTESRVHIKKEKGRSYVYYYYSLGLSRKSRTLSLSFSISRFFFGDVIMHKRPPVVLFEILSCITIKSIQFKPGCLYTNTIRKKKKRENNKNTTPSHYASVVYTHLHYTYF